MLGIANPIVASTNKEKGELVMSDDWKEQKWAQDVWYSGKITRRQLLG